MPFAKVFHQRNIMKGSLIVFEGLDCAGKTTLAKELAQNTQCLYSKGISSPTLIGKLAKKLPSTILFALDLVYISEFIIKPALKKFNKIPSYFLQFIHRFLLRHVDMWIKYKRRFFIGDESLGTASTAILILLERKGEDYDE